MHLWDYNRQLEVKAKAKMSLEIASSAYAFSTVANRKMSNQKWVWQLLLYLRTFMGRSLVKANVSLIVAFLRFLNVLKFDDIWRCV